MESSKPLETWSDLGTGELGSPLRKSGVIEIFKKKEVAMLQREIPEELGNPTVAVAAMCPVSIPFGFHFVGFYLSLMGKIRVPSARVIILVWRANQLGNERLSRPPDEVYAEDLTVAAPEILDRADRRDFARSRLREDRRSESGVQIWVHGESLLLTSVEESCKFRSFKTWSAGNGADSVPGTKGRFVVSGRERIGKLPFDFSEFSRTESIPSGNSRVILLQKSMEFRYREDFILHHYYREMVKIRLRREGAKGRPYYRIVVADGRSRREGAFIDTVGTYDPLKEEDGATVDLEKVDEWISKGAQPSDTVRSLIKKARQASA